MTAKTTAKNGGIIMAEAKSADEKEGVAAAGMEPEKKMEPLKREGHIKKAMARKAADKKSAGRKELKVNTFIEYYGKQVEERAIVANVKKAWTKSGKKVRDIKQMNLYVKPEESKVYYVINGTTAGSVDF